MYGEIMHTRQAVTELQETVPCLMCGTADSTPFLDVRDRLFGRPGTYHIVRCSSCDLLYVNPRPTVEALKEHYPDNYLVYTPLEDLSPLMQRIVGPFVKAGSLSRIRNLERVIGALPGETKVVDVGCGVNLYLRYLGELRGCTGVGVDFNKTVTEYVRTKLKMPVVCGTLHDAAFDDGQFDLVTMHEYLEHEPDPQRVLTEARRITRPGGHLHIEVPYIEGRPAKLFKTCWSQLDVPRHLVFFTRRTLEDMLQRCGYRLLSVRTFGVPFLIGMSVLHSLGCNNLGAVRGSGWLLVGAAGVPFLPFVPVMHELMSVVARAE